MTAAAGLDIEAVAAIICEVADQVIMPRWRNLAAHEIGTKTRPDDIVTIADREAEIELTRRLGDMLPGSRVVGEEAVAADARVLEIFRGPDPIWVIDPIDGTRKFTEGKPTFDVLVALVHKGKGVAGWIYGVTAIVLGVVVLAQGLPGVRGGSTRWARAVFLYSIVYLPLLFAVMVLDGRS